MKDVHLAPLHNFSTFLPHAKILAFWRQVIKLYYLLSHLSTSWLAESQLMLTNGSLSTSSPHFLTSTLESSNILTQLFTLCSSDLSLHLTSTIYTYHHTLCLDIANNYKPSLPDTPSLLFSSYVARHFSVTSVGCSSSPWTLNMEMHLSNSASSFLYPCTLP